MLDSLYSLISFAAIAFTAWGLGVPFVRRSKLCGEDRLGRHVWSLALGLVVAGLILTGLGICGWLNETLIRVLTLVGCGWALGQVFRMSSINHELEDNLEDSETSTQFSRPPVWWQRGLYVASLIALTGSLISALAPATAGDALCYHLELPKRFLDANAITFVPWHDNATFPLLTEMWFAWGLALEGAVTAQLIHWGLGVLFAGAVMCLARDLLGRDWAWTAGAIALLVPAVSNQMSAPLNDIALAAFTTLAIIAWRKCLDSETATNARAQRSWIVRAGLMAGAALAIKYVAFLFVAALGLATAWELLRRRVGLRTTVLASVSVLMLAAVVSSTWYARAAWYRGNPVYPFFASLAGDDDGPATIRESKRPLNWNVVDVAMMPWQVTMSPDEFGGRGHQLGCLFLATLPGLLFVRRLRGLSFLLLFAMCYFLLWFALRQNLRFLLPAVPPLIVGTTWVLAETSRFAAFPRLLTRVAVAGALALMAVAPLYRARQHVIVALGMESREVYLQREEPTYLAAQFAAKELPANARILSQDYRLFYFENPVTRETILRRETHYERGLAGKDVSQKLRAEGYSHVLLAETLSGDVHYNATLSKLIAQAEETAGKTVEPLLEYETPTAEGELRRYRLIELR